MALQKTKPQNGSTAGMLSHLKRKFVGITMTLIAAVLVSVLAVLLISSWDSHERIVTSSLEKALEAGPATTITMGDSSTTTGGLIVATIEVSSDGLAVQTSNSPVVINGKMLEAVMADALPATTRLARGTNDDYGVTWMSSKATDGSVRIAIADTSTIDASFRTLVIRSTGAVAVAFAVLFIVTERLAAWALAPVGRAWEQQRRFIADASHELKTPLAVILANSGILKKDQSIPDESRHWVDSTAEEAAHMRALVEDLLQLARADESASGGAVGAMAHDRIDFSEVVEQACLEFDAVAFEHDLRIESEIEPGIEVIGDAEWLKRVARILIENACKYGLAGTAVTVCLKAVGRMVRLTVNNRGETIPTEDLSHLFERFWRSDKARAREGDGGTGGFGLGLAIAKASVEAHHGTIGAESSDEEGTTFTVSLPVA